MRIRRIIRLLSGLALGVGLIWLAFVPDFEPLMTSILALVTLLGSYAGDKRGEMHSSIKELRSRGWHTIEAEGSVYIWGGPTDGFSMASGLPGPRGLVDAMEARGIERHYTVAENLPREEGRGLAQVFELLGGDVLRPMLHDSQVLIAMRPRT